MVEFSPEVEALFNVIDVLRGEVVPALVGLGNKKPKKTPPMKRPNTAWTRVPYERRKREHYALVARVLPPE